MTTHMTLTAGEICCDPTFDARDGADLDRSHVRTLSAVITNGNAVEPLLVWKDPQDDQYKLLDGRHRLAAYRTLKKTQRVPVRVFEGTAMEAMEAAARANSIARLPLTPTQRKDLAWKLVWYWGIDLSISRTARAAGVSPRFVSIMRVQARSMQSDGRVSTGSWYIDSRNPEQAHGGYQEMTEKERKKTIKGLAEKLQEAAGMWPKKDVELFAEAREKAWGQHDKQASEWSYGTEWGELTDDRPALAEVDADADF